jgi:signal transduction histidine kinase
VELDPAGLMRNLQPPPVIIEAMKVDQKIQPLRLPLAAAPAGISHSSLKTIRIAPGRESFEFEFTALSFTAPEKVRFRYRVEGLETKWFEVGEQRSAHYSSLPPGDYTFHVIACNDDGVWNDAGATLAFVVLPWFWQTAWFKMVTGLAVVGLVVIVVRNIERRRTRLKLAALKRERELDHERARIARDIHDDLGASVTQVAFLGDLTGRSADRPEAVRRHSQHIADAAREMAQSLDAIVWAVKPSNDTLRNLIEYLHRRTNEVLENLPRRYTFAIPPQIPDRIVSAELRHNVFLAYREALTNILKHAQASEVAIRIALDPDTLQIDIRDKHAHNEPTHTQRPPAPWTPPAEEHSRR